MISLNDCETSVSGSPFLLVALLVTFLFVVFHDCPGSHFLRPTAVATFALSRFLDVFVLALLLLANSLHVFLFWHHFTSELINAK
jgi:hypothetical protein